MAQAKMFSSREEAISESLGRKKQGPKKTYASRNPGHDSCVRGPITYVQTMADGSQYRSDEPAIRVMFNEGPGGDEFSTTDLEIQQAIENSPFYGVEYFLIDEAEEREVKPIGPVYTTGISSTKPAKP